MSLACRVTESRDFGSHTMFIAEIISVQAEDAYMDQNGRFDLAKADPIVYSHGSYYSLGERLGSFGYSVRKK